MTKTFWVPGMTRMPGPHSGGGGMEGGPPRIVHHITWDELNAKGERPSFSGVAKYLVREGYEPHLMLDPILGGGAQFLPLNRSAYALEHRGSVETNRMGTACIQVEWFFTPGCVVNGKRYESLKDTPMKGMDLVLDIAREYGIPALWPMGEPTKYGKRSTVTWRTRSGHYGHSHVPTNSHTDPGPMTLNIANNEEDEVTPQDKQDIIDGVVAKLGGPRPGDHSDPDTKVISNGDILTAIEKSTDKIINAFKGV